MFPDKASIFVWKGFALEAFLILSVTFLYINTMKESHIASFANNKNKINFSLVLGPLNVYRIAHI